MLVQDLAVNCKELIAPFLMYSHFLSESFSLPIRSSTTASICFHLIMLLSFGGIPRRHEFRDSCFIVAAFQFILHPTSISYEYLCSCITSAMRNDQFRSARTRHNALPPISHSSYRDLISHSARIRLPVLNDFSFQAYSSQLLFSLHTCSTFHSSTTRFLLLEL